jgi:uncharacterized protein
VIADTHGLLRPTVHRALAGVDVILHAGDVGGDDVLAELELIAPVYAVSGNTDPPDAARLTPALDVRIASLAVHVSHGHELGSPTPRALLARYAADVIIYGHTHHALATRVAGRLVLNPGAAGPARFRLKPSVALLRFGNEGVDAEIVALDEAKGLPHEP